MTTVIYIYEIQTTAHNTGRNAMKDISIMAAKLMAASMRTAPKAGGKDFLEIAVVENDEDLKRIAKKMRDFAPKSTNEAYWLRDADNIANCHALVLVGIREFNAR
jgi:uncharacterized ferredoxin-like protein